MLIFRKALPQDLNEMHLIIMQAQEFLHEQGLSQWQNGYPNADTLKADIEEGRAFLLLSQNEIVATTALVFGAEPTYANIHDGEWASTDPYITLHRFAVKAQHRGSGLATHLLLYAEAHALKAGVHIARIDTHPQNTPMKRLLAKNNYTHRGTIYLDSGHTQAGKRLAYDKHLK